MIQRPSSVQIDTRIFFGSEKNRFFSFFILKKSVFFWGWKKFLSRSEHWKLSKSPKNRFSGFPEVFQRSSRGLPEISQRVLRGLSEGSLRALWGLSEGSLGALWRLSEGSHRSIRALSAITRLLGGVSSVRRIEKNISGGLSWAQKWKKIDFLVIQRLSSAQIGPRIFFGAQKKSIFFQIFFFFFFFEIEKMLGI